MMLPGKWVEVRVTMGHSGASRPRRRRRVDVFAGIKRLLLLFAVWTCAILIGYQAFHAYLKHREVAQAVAGLNSQYDTKLQDYAGELAEGERLECSADYQKELLKKQFGYTERNETPIIILHDTDQDGK
jgi:hypothetical protein